MDVFSYFFPFKSSFKHAIHIVKLGSWTLEILSVKNLVHWELVQATPHFPTYVQHIFSTTLKIKILGAGPRKCRSFVTICSQSLTTIHAISWSIKQIESKMQPGAWKKTGVQNTPKIPINMYLRYKSIGNIHWKDTAKGPTMFPKCAPRAGKNPKNASIIPQDISRSQNQCRHSKSTLLERIPLKIPNQNMPNHDGSKIFWSNLDVVICP
jgi:hypothetical protein